MHKLLIVDDHRMFADGIRFLLEQTVAYDVIGIVETGREVIPFLGKHPAHILLLDIDLPDMTGLDVLKAIRPLFPDIKVLILSMLNDAQSIRRAFEAGAIGYCLKTAGQEELFRAIQFVCEGKQYAPSEFEELEEALDKQRKRYDLTEREAEIIQLIVAGESSKQIASKLFLSIRTVETHRKNIYRKLGVHTNVELSLFTRTNDLT
ncbi:response regulator transcription factor [Spirosoma daeguense]